MKKIFPIIILIMIFRSGFAQSVPNGFDLALDKKAKGVRCLPCGENGCCIVGEVKSRKVHQLSIVHIDTMMQPRWDTTLRMSEDYMLGDVFYEDGTLVMLSRKDQKSRVADQMIVYLYDTRNRKMETREISGIPAATALSDWHYYRGNLMFTAMSKSGDGVWFLPAGFSQPFPFTFTQETPGRVLTTAVDTLRGGAVICFNSGERTMYFETDFNGKSSFANILNEASTNAQWIPVSRKHSVLMLYYQDDEIFFMHPINILNHKVMPVDTVYCADIAAPKTLPNGVSAKRIVIVAPYSYISFYPTHATCSDGKISCVTELFYAEYSNYFNGWYVEPRFNGYRYERADVHFFDTNGVFLTNVTYPYNEEMPVHTNVYKVLNVSYLPSGDILLYHIVSREFTTMLLDSNCVLKSPISTADIPIMRASSSGTYKTVPVAMRQWYGNRFLFIANRVNLGSQKVVGISLRKLEYNQLFS